ncbi:MAG TPA: hypothetical protein PKD90_02465 [Phnomibacter sp.]|nr:hypothetical protein [Phnomibacter sp.]
MHLLFTVFVAYVFAGTALGHKQVSFSERLVNLNPADAVYLGLNAALYQIKVNDDGCFAMKALIEQDNQPAFFYLAAVTSKGKIEYHTPIIWFEADVVDITIDWGRRTYQMEAIMPRQLLSEQMEMLKGSALKK